MTPVHTSSIGWGDHGTKQTLALMAALINEGTASPSIVTMARNLAVAGGVRNQYAQATAIRQWLARVWKFVDDPSNRELLIAPDALMDAYGQCGYIAGDCDEAAVLGGALGKSIGLDVTLTVLAFPSDEPGKDPFQHVYASLLTNDAREITLDVTRPRGPVPPVTRTYTIDV